MTPEELQLILDETWPTGTFGDARPAPALPPAPRVRRPPSPVSKDQAAEHRAELLAALDGFRGSREALSAPPRGDAKAGQVRHLHALPTLPDPSTSCRKAS